jgi:hypothetical protein
VLCGGLFYFLLLQIGFIKLNISEESNPRHCDQMRNGANEVRGGTEKCRKPAKAGALTYGTYQTFALQMRLGANGKMPKPAKAGALTYGTYQTFASQMRLGANGKMPKPAKAGALTYGTYQTFASQMRLGAQGRSSKGAWWQSLSGNWQAKGRLWDDTLERSHSIEAPTRR